MENEKKTSMLSDKSVHAWNLAVIINENKFPAYLRAEHSGSNSLLYHHHYQFWLIVSL